MANLQDLTGPAYNWWVIKDETVWGIPTQIQNDVQVGKCRMASGQTFCLNCARRIVAWQSGLAQSVQTGNELLPCDVVWD